MGGYFVQGKKQKAENEGPTQHEVAELEKEINHEVSSCSKEKVATDIASDKEGGIRTLKKRARAT